jgi:putative transposase
MFSILGVESTMNIVPQPRQLLPFIFAGWVNREQQLIIEYLLTENDVLKQKVGKRRIARNENS